MYNEALMNAVNADRERLYAELDRVRRQREIAAERAAERDAELGDASTGSGRSRRRAAGRTAPVRHLAAR
ncbi:hypothetical protein [Humibacter sp.]|jgi:hypothetical protein|uniref:hypothetical protein n=1 Tax=Humibacter sp. TaxID=1940291 RepID=UPI003F7D53C7